MRIVLFVLTIIMLIGIAACIEPIPSDAEPVCGDGTIDAGEQCDLGTANTDVACDAAYGESCSYCTGSCESVTLTGDSCGDGTCQAEESASTCAVDCDTLPLGSFSGEYYTGESFDVFVAERTDASIDFDWGSGAPMSGMPVDFFSVRWEGRFAFETDNYTFNVTTDDGMRVWLDDELILDEWREQLATFTVTVPVRAGEHTIRVDYFEREWGAIARLDWQPASEGTEPDPEPVDPVPLPNGTRTITYTADTTTDFANPERGWLRHTSSTGAFDGLRDQGITTVWTTTYSSDSNLFRLDDFRYGDISQARLDALDAWFAELRDAGLKVKVRFSYNGNPDVGDDAPVESILRHIEQLEPILRKNADVIAMMDASFVGKWSEWHSSDFGITDWTSEGRQKRASINNALLNALPESRMIGHRYPTHIYEFYGEDPWVSEDEYFTGTGQSRVGWLNDCFLQGETNVGTFDKWTGNLERDREIFDNIGAYAVASAETCAAGGGTITEYNNCDGAVAEMEIMNGPDLLNSDYWTGNYDHWKEYGCYDDISRRLGYRLVLESVTIPEGAASGEATSVSFTMRNDGFGKVYNPRPLELVFDGPLERRVRLTDDARRDLPLGGDAPSNREIMTYSFVVPPDLPAGSYALRLALPDASASIADDARYAIRLANVNMWNSVDGTNDLRVTMTIE